MADTLLELRAMLPSIRPALERRRLGESLSQIAAAIRNADAEMQRLDAVLDLARLTLFPPEELSDLIEDALGAGEALASAATSDELRSASDAYEEFVRTLPRVGAQVARHWKNDVVAKAFRPLIAWGRLLEKVENRSALGREMRECGATAANTQIVKWPELRDDVVRLKDQLARLQRERSERVSAIPAVGEFLIAVGNGTATLALLTPQVLHWLDENGALESFKVIS